MERIKTKKFTWINIQKADHKIIESLQQEFGFHELNLEDCLSRTQRPKIDSQDDYIFIVLHFPRYYKNLKKMTTTELNIFLGKNYIVTLEEGELKPLKNYFNTIKEAPETLAEITEKDSAMILYEIIDHLLTYCFPILDKISERLSKVDDQLLAQRPSQIVLELARLNQEIITFRKIISPERYVIRDLEDKIKPFLAEENDIYFDDITDSVEKIWDTLENLKEVSESLQRTHDSYATNRLNEVMKILTVFSAIMLPLTVITGFYGMNVNGLPAATHDFAAEIITVFMVILSISMLYYFSRKDYF
jgi:magnesium transporter